MNQINNDLTIIVTSSYIQSHPKITLIKEVLDSLKLIKYQESTVYEKCHIILAHDYNNNPNYKLYLQNLDKYLKDEHLNNMQIIVRKTHGHLTGNIRNVMKYIKTSFMFVIQHDFPFIRSFDITTVIKDMKENLFLKVIRFNKRMNWPGGIDRHLKDELYGKQIITNDNVYTRTAGWSDQNHICLVSYYKSIVLKKVNDGQFMERILMRIVTVSNHEKYGFYIYGKRREERYIEDKDGRKYKG